MAVLRFEAREAEHACGQGTDALVFAHTRALTLRDVILPGHGCSGDRRGCWHDAIWIGA